MYPLLRIHGLLHTAKVTARMRTLDLPSRYWQIAVAKEDRVKTVFTIPSRNFHFKRMSFGTRNARASFKRYMGSLRASLSDITIAVYLDGIIICSKNFKTHINELNRVFKRLNDYKFFVNYTKSHFCCAVVKYQRHILRKSNIVTDAEMNASFNLLPLPRNTKQIASFLQFARGTEDLYRIRRRLVNH